MPLFSFINCFTFLFFVTRRAQSLGNVTTTRVIIDGIPYSKTEVILQAEKATKQFIIQDGMFLPSDLITMLPNKAEFYIQILLRPEQNVQYFLLHKSLFRLLRRHMKLQKNSYDFPVGLAPFIY